MKLITQNTRGEPLNIRNQVINELREALEALKKVAATTPCTTSQSESHLVSIERKMAIIESIITNQSKTWAQVASPLKTPTDSNAIKTREQKTANRKERAI